MEISSLSLLYLHLLIHMLLQVVIAEENFDGISNLKFAITLVRPVLVFNTDVIVALYAGSPFRQFLVFNFVFYF